MKALANYDLNQIEKLHSIYYDEIPECILDVIESIPMKRIGEIGQNCGRDYLANCFQNFAYNYSRKTHSVGVALIVWRFTKDIKMTLSGLFHDIAAPTFSHVVDFYNGDATKQESTEELTEKIINDSPEIQKVLKKYNLTTKDVCDYSMYPIADNKSPKLSADRLEYTCYMSTAMGLISFDTLKKLVEDIYIADVGCEKEMCFKTKKYAKKFAEIAIECGRFMSSPLSNIANNFLADTLKAAVEEKVLVEDDFNKLTEDELILKMENSNNLKVLKYWNTFKSFDKVWDSKEEDLDNYCINVKVKSRYINPLCSENTKPTRIADLDVDIKNNIEDFVTTANTKYCVMNVKKDYLKD